MADTLFGGLSRFMRSPAFKFLLIGVLILLLSIPLVLVWGLVSERQMRASEVRFEVGRMWGGEQTLTGPALVVPYVIERVEQENGRQVSVQIERRAVFLPEHVDIAGTTNSELLHRSIYDVPVYRAETTIKGRYTASSIDQVTSGALSVRWSDAVLLLGVTDVAALKEASSLEIGPDRLSFEPSIGVPNSATMSGIHVRLTDARSLQSAATTGRVLPAFDFTFKLSFSGTGALRFTPAARETAVSLASDWAHPSFSGAFLPVERAVRPDGFTASWTVPHLARSVPQAWDIAEQGPDRLVSYAFGVDFYVPVDFYDLVNRALKYGLLFVSAAFMAVFLLELTAGRNVHPVQYLLVGTAMVFFFVLLLSLAEHLGFGLAYLVASIATGGMLSLYVSKALATPSKGLVMLGLFAVLYGLLYLVLRLEDYALLAGAIAGFVMLTATMFLTLRVDWSGAGMVPEKPPADPGPAS